MAFHQMARVSANRKRNRRRRLRLAFQQLRPSCVAVCRFQELVAKMNLPRRCSIATTTTTKKKRRKNEPNTEAVTTYFVAGDHQLDPSWFEQGTLEMQQRGGEGGEAGTGTGAAPPVEVFSTLGHPVHTGRPVTKTPGALAATTNSEQQQQQQQPWTLNATTYAHFLFRKAVLDFFLLTEADLFASNCNYWACYSPAHRAKRSRFHGHHCENTFAYHVDLHRGAAAAASGAAAARDSVLMKSNKKTHRAPNYGLVQEGISLA